jgi:hypothetical protein
VKFSWGDKIPAEGTVLIFGVRYRGSNSGRIYTYAALLTGRQWYFSGAGQVPQAASWAAVERWLERDDREVVYIDAVTEMTPLWRPGPELEGRTLPGLTPRSDDGKV